MAFDQDGAGVSAQRYRRRVVHGAAGDNAFGLAHVGDDGLEREADASGHASEAERGAHDLEESAARDGVDPFGGAFGEFAVQGFFEFFGAGEFFEAAPVFGAGFFGGVVGRGGVDAFADIVQVQFFRRTDVFALFDLDQTARIFFVVRHCLKQTMPQANTVILSVVEGPDALRSRQCRVREFSLDSAGRMPFIRRGEGRRRGVLRLHVCFASRSKHSAQDDKPLAHIFHQTTYGMCCSS